MTRSMFALIFAGFTVSCVAAQGSPKVAPSPYKIAEDPFPRSVSSDGRYLTYVGDVDGDDHTFIRNIKTGETRALTTGPGESGDFPIISPDGKYVAYDFVTGGSSDALWQLRVRNFDGSGERVVYREKGLLFLHPRGWSADGQHVLIDVLRRDGKYQLAMVSIADGSLRVIKTLPLPTLNGRKPYNMVRISPDGRHVAYEFPPGDSSRRQTFVISTNTGDGVPLAPIQANDRLLDWTPDGKRILFASARSGTWGFWTTQGADGKQQGSPELLRADVGLIDKGMGFTDDGSYYYAAPAWKNDVYLAAFDAETGKLGKPQKWVDHVGFRTSVEWSPNGRELACVYGHGDQLAPFVLALRSLETGQERRVGMNGLTRFGFHAFHPHWSPDGRVLLAVGRDKNYSGPGVDSLGIYRIDARSGGIALMMKTDSYCWPDCVEWPVWSADGKLIYMRWQPRSIVSRDVTLNKETEIYRVPQGGGGISRLAASPDGAQVAFVAQKDTVSLKVVTAAGGQPRELVRVPMSESISAVAWTPDSSHIIYSVIRRVIDDELNPDKQEFELWRVPAKGGPPESLGLRMTGLQAYGLSVHPDGQRIAFTAGTPLRSEVWMLKDLLGTPQTPDPTKLTLKRPLHERSHGLGRRCCVNGRSGRIRGSTTASGVFSSRMILLVLGQV